MEVMQVLHMNGGNGENSYSRNSTVQSKIISLAKPIVEEAVLQIMNNNYPESMGIADLGCSSGPNTLQLISEILSILNSKCSQLGRPLPELRVFLNDLFNNDFNGIFVSLPAFYDRIKVENGFRSYSCFISGVPGSFYGRLFPSNSLHLVHSSSSLHWLSQVPTGLENDAREALNKGKIFISKNSPQIVLDAYSTQFQKDFSLFLSSRSRETVSGGRLVLSFMGRASTDPTSDEEFYHWELLGQALMSMAKEGLVEEQKVDSFNAPYYAPCPEEIRAETEKEGSFVIDRLEAFEIDWDGGGREVFEAAVSAQRVAKTIRAVVESMLQAHFGMDIMDDLFRRFQELVENHLSKTRAYYVNLVISMIKK
ncbi:hypothetical protein SLE2022_099450 [Rubroshorea leprosula]